MNQIEQMSYDLLDEEARDFLRAFFKESLSDLEYQVVDMRVGLSDGHTHSLGEIEERLDITQDQLRKIARKVKRTLDSATLPSEKLIVWRKPDDPDEVLAQCVLDNGIVLGNPVQFSIFEMEMTENSSISLISRGNHLLVSFRQNQNKGTTQKALDFIHFNSKEAFELVSFSDGEHTMIVRIDKKNARKKNMSLNPLKVCTGNPPVGKALLLALKQQSEELAESALSALGRVLRTKCDVLSLRDFGYDNYESELSESLSLTIEELNLSIWTRNCLMRYGIRTVADIVSMRESELKSIRFMNQKCISEIKWKIRELDLWLKDYESF